MNLALRLSIAYFLAEVVLRPNDPRFAGKAIPIRNLLPSVGAGFVVALCGDIMLMPGLGRDPAFQQVDIDEQGRTIGLF